MAHEAPKIGMEEARSMMEQADNMAPSTDELEKVCAETKEKGGSFVEASMCRIVNSPEYRRMAGLRDFVNKLAEQFLNTLEGYKGVKGAKARLEALDEVVGMQDILESYSKCSSYKIYGRPAAVVFYFPGEKKTVRYLEWTDEQKQKLFEGMLRESGRRKTHPLGPAVPEHEVPIDMAEREAERAARAKTLSTPDAAYDRLSEIAPDWPEDLRQSLSEPLARWSQIVAGWNPDKDGNLNMSKEDIAELESLGHELLGVIQVEFGDRSEWTSAQRAALRDIAEEFSVE